MEAEVKLVNREWELNLLNEKCDSKAKMRRWLLQGYDVLDVEYAGIVYKDLAPNVIKRIIGLIQKYGLDKTDMAFRKATYMKRDNPKRNLEYIIGILRTGREITIPE